ncbi:23S rRNA (uracil(1939)-C(5))-methyltransferase RlmD [Tolumonas lignilytica]|uniref:23S rRNA (uracil(1939)-C(5))-methyltransferase RlmD n=1 Tax=Tolumonas lignilytica TaxID=1283284 RepID=UPI000465A615|nr:23S rRNA (uracil(1939)-C(5))-methyltransferase RlmD [Tolumonas lignilytica]
MRQHGQPITLSVNELSDKGDGIADWQGRKVFIPATLPGEVVTVSPYGIKPKYAQAQLLDIVNVHPQRVEPHCPYSECGGCQLAHLAYVEQLKLKQQLVIDALLSKQISQPVSPCLGMQSPLAFRNKAIYAVRSENGEPQIGFYRKNSHQVIDIVSCPVQHAQTTEIIAAIRHWMKEFNIAGYDEEKHSGCLRYVMIRHGFKTKACMVVLVTLTDELPHKAELLNLLTKIENIESIIQNINPAPVNRILGDKQQICYGNDVITDELHALTFNISAHSFYQVNPQQTDVLYETALNFAELTGNETVFDIYCGIGTISLYLAQKAKKVIGIEIVAQAIDDARDNAARNEITNTEFYVGKAEEVVPLLYDQKQHADVIVVDPPRKGCDPIVLQTMVSMKPERIVYVSCEPASLARDLAILQQSGYYVTKIQPVDMFPHSMHVETIVQLQKI